MWTTSFQFVEHISLNIIQNTDNKYKYSKINNGYFLV